MSSLNTEDLQKNDDLIQIFNALGKNEDSVRFIGGFVRDKLLGKESNDIDIATIYTPEQVMDKLAGINIKTIPTGIKYGTVTAVIGSQTYEITTLREDISCDGRRAIVKFTSNWTSDAFRRDFTINALSSSLKGAIYDYSTGLDDLNNKIVRFIGNPSSRIQEDHLRILRFFRFTYLYAQEVDYETLDIIKQNNLLLEDISGERIQSEFFKLFSSKQATLKLEAIFKHIQDCNLNSNIALNNNLEFDLISNIYRCEKMLGSKLDKIIYIFILSSENLENIIKRWKLPNKISKALYLLKQDLGSYNNFLDYNKETILMDIGHERFINLLLIKFLNDIHNPIYVNILDSAKNFVPPKFPLNGNDIKSLGINNGLDIKKLLEIGKEFWKSNNYMPVKQELLKHLKSIL